MPPPPASGFGSPTHIGGRPFAAFEFASVRTETLPPVDHQHEEGLRHGSRRFPKATPDVGSGAERLRSLSPGAGPRRKMAHTSLFIYVGKCSGDPMSLAMCSALKSRPVPCEAAWTQVQTLSPSRVRATGGREASWRWWLGVSRRLGPLTLAPASGARKPRKLSPRCACLGVCRQNGGAEASPRAVLYVGRRRALADG